MSGAIGDTRYQNAYLICEHISCAHTKCVRRRASHSRHSVPISFSAGALLPVLHTRAYTISRHPYLCTSFSLYSDAYYHQLNHPPTPKYTPCAKACCGCCALLNVYTSKCSALYTIYNIHIIQYLTCTYIHTHTQIHKFVYRKYKIHTSTFKRYLMFVSSIYYTRVEFLCLSLLVTPF